MEIDGCLRFGLSPHDEPASASSTWLLREISSSKEVSGFENAFRLFPNTDTSQVALIRHR
jgi:hypothetical protein